jgi:hypothetical protein
MHIRISPRQTPCFDDCHLAISQSCPPDGGGIERMYWDNWMQVATFTKINSTSLEGFQIVSFDGAGRVWYEGGDHPDGAAGKFSVRTYEYDAVGRRYWSSNPTQVSAVLDEVAGHLTPTGDDAVSGYRWTNI